MATIGLLDLDLWGRTKSPPSLELINKGHFIQ